MNARRWKARATTAALAAACLAIPLAVGETALPATAAQSHQNQPNIDARLKGAISQQGLVFHDSSGNGKVDRYEDWRLTPEERAKDLVKRMTLEEKAGLMLISSEFIGAFPGQPPLPPRATPIDEVNPIAEGYIADNVRYLILRDNPTAYQLADRANKYQEIAEGTRLGIPIVFTSNPRNHVNPTQQFGISEATGMFSLWPGTLGLGATHDPAILRDFAETARAEFRAAGIHKLYGYQIETATEPRWNRNAGTFGESPDLNAEFARELVLGFQGEALNATSVAQTIKHFPGDGPVVNGLDPHAKHGQWATYPTPGSLYDYQLPPFAAAIEAGASSVMSYYNVPQNSSSAEQLPKHLWHSETEQFEEIAGAYSSQFLQGLLRDELGFDGYVNTDSGALAHTAWNAEHLTRPERFAKSIKAGASLFSDERDPADLIAAVKTGLLKEKELDPSVRLLLEEIFTLGLFEDPYVDPTAAQQIAGSAESPAILIFTPIFLPIVIQLGVDPIHFGTMMVFNMCLGNISPPVGNNLFVAARVAKVSIEPMITRIMPIFWALTVALFLVAFVPQLSMWLPTVMGLTKP